MDQELFELCKDVYERTGWDGTEKVLYTQSGDTWATEPTRYQKLGNHPDIGSSLYPLYTSDYLLGKLPRRSDLSLDLFEDSVKLTFYDGDESPYIIQKGDTPLKALLKLTIALHEAGELK